jgi:hypothetical protein
MEANVTVRVVQDYEGPDLIRQTPGQTGVWEGIRYTLEPIGECDYLIVLRSQMRNPISVTCPKENVWAIVQDPYIPGFNDWLVEGYEHFSRVYTQSIPRNKEKFAISQPALPWYVNRSYDQLVDLAIPPKPKILSCIAGNQSDIPGHFKRKAFLNILTRQKGIDIDLFGHAGVYLADKADGLLPYQYSLAIENSSIPDYWTEKIADCFLCWTVPIYYGSTNLEKYFPPESFIRIDIEKPQEAFTKIRSLITNDVWEKRLPALKAARQLVLDRYQFFPYFSMMIGKESKDNKNKVKIEIPVYVRSLKSRIRRLGYKIGRDIRRIYPLPHN